MPYDKPLLSAPMLQEMNKEELEFFVDLAINETQRWLEAATREPFLNDDDFLFSIRHGSQLKKIVNFLSPGSFPLNEGGTIAQVECEQKHQHWTKLFCQICLRLGINRLNIFLPKDLGERHPCNETAQIHYTDEALARIRRVVVTVYELACLCESSLHYSGPRIDRSAIEPLFFYHTALVSSSTFHEKLNSDKTLPDNSKYLHCPTSVISVTQEITESEESGCGSSLNDQGQHSVAEYMDSRSDVDPLVRDKVTKYLREQLIGNGNALNEDQMSESQFSDHTFASFSPEEFEHPTSNSTNLSSTKSQLKTLAKPTVTGSVRHDPHRFVASKPAPLAQQASDQLKLINNEKRARMARTVIKEDEISWMPSLSDWRMRRRGITVMDSFKQSKDLESVHPPHPPNSTSEENTQGIHHLNAPTIECEERSTAPGLHVLSSTVEQLEEVSNGNEFCMTKTVCEHMVALPEADLNKENDDRSDEVLHDQQCNKQDGGLLGFTAGRTEERFSLLTHSSGQAHSPVASYRGIVNSNNVNELAQSTIVMGSCLQKPTADVKGANERKIEAGSHSVQQSRTHSVICSSLRVDPASVGPERTSIEETGSSISFTAEKPQQKSDTVLTEDMELVLRQQNKHDRGFGLVLKGGKNSGEPIHIDHVIPGSPACIAGIKPGDVLTAVNGLVVKDELLAKVNMLIREASVVGELELSVRRNSLLGERGDCSGYADTPQQACRTGINAQHSADSAETYSRAAFEQRRSLFAVPSDKSTNSIFGERGAKSVSGSNIMTSFSSKDANLSSSRQRQADTSDQSIPRIEPSYHMPYPCQATNSGSSGYRVVSMHEPRLPGKITDFIPENDRGNASIFTSHAASIRSAKPDSASTTTQNYRRPTADRSPTLIRNYNLGTLATNLRSSVPNADDKCKHTYNTVNTKCVTEIRIPRTLSTTPNTRKDMDNQGMQDRTSCALKYAQLAMKESRNGRLPPNPAQNIYDHWMVREAECKRMSEQLSEIQLGSGRRNVSNRNVFNANGDKTPEGVINVSVKHLCAHCQKELGQGAAMNIESLALFYHLACFRCHVCGVSLGDGAMGAEVRVRSGKLHCQSCFSNDEAGYRLSEV